MFNRLRDITAGGGTERGPAPPTNVNLTFDGGEAVIHFEDQLQAPPGAPAVTQPQRTTGLLRHGGQSWEQRRFNRREGNPPPSHHPGKKNHIRE